MRKILTLAAAVLTSFSLWAQTTLATFEVTLTDAPTAAYASYSDADADYTCNKVGSNSSSNYCLVGTHYYMKLTANDAYVKIKLKSGNIVAGDIVYVYHNHTSNKNGVGFAMTSGGTNGSTGNATANTELELSYTLTASDIASDGSISVYRQGSNLYVGRIVVVRPAPACAAGEPGDISKGDLVTGTLTLIAAGSPATGDAWYWQTTEDGVSTDNPGATLDVTVAGTYYIRSFNDENSCWSDAKSFEVKAVDLVENYTVKYLDGTTVLGQEVVEVGQAPEGIENPKKDCYAFDGWQQGGVDIAIPDVTGTADEVIELTAKWAPVYAVSFNFGDSTTLTKNNIKAKLNAAGYSCSVGTSGGYDAGGTTGYLGYKFKNNGDYVAFIIAAGREAIVTYGYTESGWQVNGEDAGITVKTQAYVDKKYQAVGSDLLLKIVNQSADSKTSALTKIIIRDIPSTSDDDATLSELTVTGFTLTPSFDPAVEEYSITKAYQAKDPAKSLINAVPNNPEAHSLTIDSLGGSYTITVVSKDETVTKVYTINVLEADAPRALKEIIMSNKYQAYILASEPKNIYAYKMVGYVTPTVQSCVVSEGATWVQEDDKLIVTGEDSKFDEYTLIISEVEPVEFTADEIAFNGTETWVKSGYGWDATNSCWKFSKTDTDYSREIAGKTHVDMWLPECDTIVLKKKSGDDRDIRIYANGIAVGDKYKLVSGGVAIAVNQPAPFILTIASAQTSGDGRLGSIRMAKAILYTVDIDGDTENGAVGFEAGVHNDKFAAGAEVTLTNIPEDGYILDEYVVYKKGEETTLVTVTDGKFTMPAYDVVISATFKVDPATAINNTEAEVKAVKFIENGQFFIIKNGIKYNANGAIVK